MFLGKLGMMKMHVMAKKIVIAPLMMKSLEASQSSPMIESTELRTIAKLRLP